MTPAPRDQVGFAQPPVDRISWSQAAVDATNTVAALPPQQLRLELTKEVPGPLPQGCPQRHPASDLN